MSYMITRPIASAAERIAASTYLWGHTGVGPATDLRIAITDIVTKDVGGNAGIGTTAPLARLHVAGGNILLTNAFFLSSRNAADNASIPLIGQNSSDEVVIDPSGFGTRIGSGGAIKVVSAGHILAGVDNTQNIGSASFRFATVFAGTGTINTSDEREKIWRGEMTDAEFAAATEIFDELGFFQFKDGVRYHFGARAQRVWNICQKHGLAPKIDASGLPETDMIPPAFLCWDKWDEESEPIIESVEVDYEVEDWEPTGQKVVVNDVECELTQKVVRTMKRTEQRDVGKTRIRAKAGNRYGLRFDELNMFLMAAINRRQSQIENRITALEGAS